MEILGDFWGIIARWRCWYLMSWQDIVLRYRRSAIGPFWISLSIGIFVIGVSYVYAELFGDPFQQHLNRVATGYLLWYYLSLTVVEGSHGVTEAAGTLKSVYLPISVLAARVVARNIIILLHNFAAIIPIMIIFGGHHFTWTMLWLVPGLALYVVLGVLVGIALGPLGARYRDITEILRVTMQLLFFLTPVIWPADKISANSAIVAFNPFYHLIELGRAPMLGSAPTSENWMVALACTALFLAAALISISNARQRLPLWV